MKFSFPKIFTKIILSALIGAVMLGFGIHFLSHEGVQIAQIRDALDQSDRPVATARRPVFGGLHLAARIRCTGKVSG